MDEDCIMTSSHSWTAPEEYIVLDSCSEHEDTSTPSHTPSGPNSVRPSGTRPNRTGPAGTRPNSAGPSGTRRNSGGGSRTTPRKKRKRLSGAARRRRKEQMLVTVNSQDSAFKRAKALKARVKVARARDVKVMKNMRITVSTPADKGPTYRVPLTSVPEQETRLDDPWMTSKQPREWTNEHNRVLCDSPEQSGYPTNHYSDVSTTTDQDWGTPRPAPAVYKGGHYTLTVDYGHSSNDSNIRYGHSSHDFGQSNADHGHLNVGYGQPNVGYGHLSIDHGSSGADQAPQNRSRSFASPPRPLFKDALRPRFPVTESSKRDTFTDALRAAQRPLQSDNQSIRTGQHYLPPQNQASVRLGPIQPLMSTPVCSVQADEHTPSNLQYIKREDWPMDDMMAYEGGYSVSDTSYGTHRHSGGLRDRPSHRLISSQPARGPLKGTANKPSFKRNRKPQPKKKQTQSNANRPKNKNVPRQPRNKRSTSALSSKQAANNPPSAEVPAQHNKPSVTLYEAVSNIAAQIRQVLGHSSLQPSIASDPPGPSTVQPSIANDLPGPSTVQPSIASDLPGPITVQPSAARDPPGPNTVQPSAASDLPGPNTVQPSAASDPPGPSTVQPSAASDPLGPSTVQPSIASDLPGPSTVQPSIASDLPGPNTVQPSAASDPPGPNTVQPSAASDLPGPNTVQPSIASDPPGPSTAECLSVDFATAPISRAIGEVSANNEALINTNSQANEEVTNSTSQKASTAEDKTDPSTDNTSHTQGDDLIANQGDSEMADNQGDVGPGPSFNMSEVARLLTDINTGIVTFVGAAQQITDSLNSLKNVLKEQ